MKTATIFLISLLLLSRAQTEEGATETQPEASGLNIPHVNFAADQAAINDIKNNYLPDLVASYQNYETQNVDLGVFQVTDLWLKELVVPANATTVTLNNGYVSMVASQVAFVAVVNATSSISAIAATPNAEISASNSEVSFDITSTYSNGVLTFEVNQVVVSLNNLETTGLTFNGETPATAVYQNPLESQLASNLESFLQNYLTTLAATYLVPTAVPGLPLTIDYSPVENIEYLSDAVTLPLEGGIYNNETHTRLNDTDMVNLPLYDSNFDFTGFFAQYVINSGLYGLWQAEWFNTTIANIIALDGSNSELTTSTFNNVIPGLTTQYGENVPVQVVCWDIGGTAPSVVMMPGSNETAVNNESRLLQAEESAATTEETTSTSETTDTSSETTSTPAPVSEEEEEKQAEEATEADNIVENNNGFMTVSLPGQCGISVLQNGEWTPVMTVNGTALMNVTASLNNNVATVVVDRVQAENLEIITNNLENSELTSSQLQSNFNQFFAVRSPRWTKTFTFPNIPVFSLSSADIYFRSEYAELATKVAPETAEESQSETTSESTPETTPETTPEESP